MGCLSTGYDLPRWQTLSAQRYPGQQRGCSRWQARCHDLDVTRDGILGIDPREEGLIRLDFTKLFGNQRPVVLEIGSGKGRFLLTRASEDPSANIIGIEKSLHYYRVIIDRVRRRGLHNIRVINYDAQPVLAEMIPAESLAEIHIYFPDPWPRPREQKRRIIRPDVVEHLQRVLAPEGVGYFVTDHRGYFDSSVPVLEQAFEVTSGTPPDAAPSRTNYEAKYREQGRPIFQIVFKKRKESAS